MLSVTRWRTTRSSWRTPKAHPRALTVMPDNPAALDSLGWVHFRAATPRALSATLEHAYSLGHDAEIAAHWGEALWVSASPARRAGSGRRRWPASPIQNRSRLHSNGSCRCADRVLRLGAAVVLCALAGCRTAPVFYPAAAPWEVRRPQLQARQHFDLSGRVAVATAHEGFNANLHWSSRARARS